MYLINLLIIKREDLIYGLQLDVPEISTPKKIRCIQAFIAIAIKESNSCEK